MNRTIRTGILAVVLPIFLVGCALVGKFDQNSYNTTQSLQAQTLALMATYDLAAPIPTNAIAAIVDKINMQIAYEQGKGASEKLGLAQWQLLADPNGKLLGGFLADWKNGVKHSPAFVIDEESLVNQEFQEIQRLESGKQR